MDLAKLSVDTEVEDGGDWVDLGKIDPIFADDSGDPEKNIWVKVRSVYSPIYRRVAARLRRKIDRQLARNLPVDPIVGDDVTKQALAEAALLGWRNLQSNGQEVSFSKENAVGIMLDRKYRRFADAVAAAAVQVGSSDSEWMEKHSGNSFGASGSGSPSTPSSNTN